MSEPRVRGCGHCCCSFIFSLGLTSLFMWLSLRTSNPKCSIQEFYLPALNRSLNDPNDTALQFQLKLENPNKFKGVYYDDVNVTIFDFPNRSHVVGSSVIPRFYQGHKKTAKKNGTAVLADRRAVFRAVSGNGSAVFRMDLTTRVRFKIVSWQTKRHRIFVGAEVEVNASGIKVMAKNIRLTSSAPSHDLSFVLVGFFLVFLC